MSEEYLVAHTAPTLAGLKTGSLFPCAYSSWPVLLREIRALGIRVLPGDANFLMLSGVPGLCGKMLEKGILLRSCANYRGLDEGDCRIAVRTHPENAELIAALREVTGHA